MASSFQGIYSIAFLLLSTAGWQGLTEKHNATSKQLYLRCLMEKYSRDDVLVIGLFRQDDDLEIAQWNKTMQGQSLYERLSIIPASDPLAPALEAVLDDVTCCEITNYTCKLIATKPNRQGFVDSLPAIVSYKGEVSKPLLEVHPLQARYQVGDSIQLTCSALIGSVNNSFIWEMRLPGEQFKIVTGEENTTSVNESGHEQCVEVRSTTSLTHVLTADDDTREWRCRLRHTGQEAVFVVAVQCLKTGGQSESCRQWTTTPPVVTKTTTSAPTRASEKREVLTQSRPTHQGHTTEGDKSLWLVLVAIIAVLFTTNVISLAILFAILRRWSQKKRATPPCQAIRNKIVASPSDAMFIYPWPISSDHSPSSHPPPGFSDCTCPSNHYEEPHDDSDDSDDDEETPPKMLNPDDTSASCASSSVFISTSAVPSLPEEGITDVAERERLVPLSKRGELVGMFSSPGQNVYCSRKGMERDSSVKSNSNSSPTHASHVTLGYLKEWEACP